MQHEALINVAFDGCAASILCPYDGSGLDPAVLADARRTHPTTRVGGVSRANPSYGDPAAVAATANAPLCEPPPTAAGLTFQAEDLGHVRQLVTARARAAGLDRERAAELQLAVSEVAANVLVHTDGPGVLRVWHDRAAVVCEVRDRGRLADLLAGRREPATDSPGGRGLLIANHLCDLVQIDPDPAGTTVRLHVRRDASGSP